MKPVETMDVVLRSAGPSWLVHSVIVPTLIVAGVVIPLLWLVTSARFKTPLLSGMCAAFMGPQLMNGAKAAKRIRRDLRDGILRFNPTILRFIGSVFHDVAIPIERICYLAVLANRGLNHAPARRWILIQTESATEEIKSRMKIEAQQLNVWTYGSARTILLPDVFQPKLARLLPRIAAAAHLTEHAPTAGCPDELRVVRAWAIDPSLAVLCEDDPRAFLESRGIRAACPHCRSPMHKWFASDDKEVTCRECGGTSRRRESPISSLVAILITLAGMQLLSLSGLPMPGKFTPTLIAFGLLCVGSSRVDLQACKLEYSIVSPK